jgi:hypothetical protein
LDAVLLTTELRVLGREGRSGAEVVEVAGLTEEVIAVAAGLGVVVVVNAFPGMPLV